MRATALSTQALPRWAVNLSSRITPTSSATHPDVAAGRHDRFRVLTGQLAAG
ncbi:MAG TPA: hypothetical protein VFE65_19780 [Pseudonocardia sp.]|nr:hypothetical protein [Pseudonocardia sp.]